MCDLMREYAAPWVSFYRLQHPVFHSITNLPTWRRYCGNACDDNSVTYLNLEKAASSCAGSQSSLLKHSRPVSLSLSSTHSKHAHTPRHREREREEARAREREKEKGERGKGHSCVSSSPGPFHLVIILTTPTPPPLPFKNTTHTSVLLDLVQQDWRWRDRAEAEGWDGREKKECRGSVSHTHTLSPHSCTHTHTCYRQHATKETADSCSADRQAAGGGTRLPSPPLGLSASLAQDPHGLGVLILTIMTGPLQVTSGPSDMHGSIQKIANQKNHFIQDFSDSFSLCLVYQNPPRCSIWQNPSHKAGLLICRKEKNSSG